MSKSFQNPRGTKDILPADQPYWRFVEDTIRKVFDGLGFNEIKTPYFESVELFLRSIGETTDIVQKELFLLESKIEDGSAKYALRPEGTAGIVRSYIQNGMSSWPQPVSLYYVGSMFRYERPQKGRYREFVQAGIEIFGDSSAKSDYLTIMSAWEVLSRLGLKDLTVYANSIGCEKCRPKYILKLKKFYKDNLTSVCADCQSRYEKNPLRLLDCKNDQCKIVTVEAPSILDNLCSDCTNHFKQTLEYLDYFGIKYDLDPKLVRGLDYYTKTVFEIASGADLGRQGTLVGGGRYDNLVSQLGGSNTPAVGYAFGIERLISMMKDQGIKPPKIKGVDVCILQLGEKAKEVSKAVFDNLTSKNINVYFVPSNDGLRQQIKSADKLGASYALIIGQQEAVKNEVILRNLENSSQETVPVSSVADTIVNNLSKLSDK